MMVPTKIPAPKADLVCPECGSLQNKCVNGKAGPEVCKGLRFSGTELKDKCFCDHCGWLGYLKDLRTKVQKGFGIKMPGSSAWGYFIFHKDLENKNENP